MRRIIFAFLLISTVSAFAQKNVFQKKGVAIKGYDVVAYFDGKAQEGIKENAVSFEGVTYYFANAKNKSKFLKNPKSYLPEYGGFCAYAMGVKGSKVSINPETYEIRNNKLYLFYNKGRTNTLSLWLDNNPENLKSQADKNWEKVLKK